MGSSSTRTGCLIRVDGLRIQRNGLRIRVDGFLIRTDGLSIQMDGLFVRMDELLIHLDGLSVYIDGSSIHINELSVQMDRRLIHLDGFSVYLDRFTVSLAVIQRSRIAPRRRSARGPAASSRHASDQGERTSATTRYGDRSRKSSVVPVERGFDVAGSAGPGMIAGR